MAMKNVKRIFYLLLTAFTISCTTVQHISKVNVSYDVPSKQSNPATDEEIKTMITPYKVQLDSKMNEVLANVATNLTKGQPESTMGNWLTDAMMCAVEREGLQADFAVYNYGGMRVPVITAGPLTMGELYEFSPFDNTLMIVDVPGNIVDSLFRFVALKDGWPVSDNIRMVIKDKQLISFTINGQPVDLNKIYKAAVPDYVANGGDNTSFMIGLKRIQTGLLVRNLLVQYAAETARSGNDINVGLQGRITIQQ
jgi:2',3'-cyclic-nucleotide 2'-phosphodiesterase (5'-nucleotidase family)